MHIRNTVNNDIKHGLLHNLLVTHSLEDIGDLNIAIAECEALCSSSSSPLWLELHHQEFIKRGYATAIGRI
jgi:hypothetical protein